MFIFVHTWLGELDMVDYFHFLLEFKMTRDNSFSHIVLEQSAWSLSLASGIFYVMHQNNLENLTLIHRVFAILSFDKKEIMMAISNKWKNLKLRPFYFLLPFCLTLSKNWYNLKGICQGKACLYLNSVFLLTASFFSKAGSIVKLCCQ